MLPLENLLVVSLEQAVAAPFATRHLADLGARVIKIERPGTGDFARSYDHKVKGLSSHFVWINRSKESLTLNLKSDRGKEILEELISRADIFIHNLAPGAVERLGFGIERLRETYPTLIICQISGYGSSGPYRDKKAYDLLVQAEAGLLSVTGTEGNPSKAGIAVADIAAGMYAFSGILSALLARNKTGSGTTIEVSMLEALAEWMGFPAYYALDGIAPPRSGALHAAIAPYGPFQCGDGQSILLGIQNEREWQSFCEVVLGRSDLAYESRFENNAQRVKNRSTLRELIVSIFRQLTQKQIVERLEKAGIANAEMRDVRDLWGHPQLVSRHRLSAVLSPAGSIPFLKTPPLIEGVEAVDRPIPELGQHTDIVLTELGYDEGEIAQLRFDNVV